MRKEQYFVTHVLLWLCWTWPFCVASPTVCVDGGIELKGDGLALAWHKRVLCGESLHLSTRLDIFPSKAQIAAEAAGRAWLKRLWKSHSSQKGTVLYQMMEDILAPYSWGGSFAGGELGFPLPLFCSKLSLCFFSLFCSCALVCTIGMLKFIGQIHCRANKHTFTQSLYMHMTTFLAMMKWNHFTKPCYSDPAPPGLWWFTSFSCRSTFYFFCFFTTDCEQLTAGKHNRVQVYTASHNNSPHFYFAILFSYVFTCLYFWANLSRLWHTDHCKQIDCGKAQSHSRQAKTTKWRQDKLSFYTVFHLLSL